MHNQKSLVAATTSPIAVNFTKSTKVIDTYVGYAKLDNDIRAKVVIMTTAENLRDGVYKVQLANMPRGNGYIVTSATNTTVIKLLDTLTEKSGAEILKAANRGDFFYVSLAFGKPSRGGLGKARETDMVDLHNHIMPTKRYWTAIDAAEKCFITDDKKLKNFFNPIVSTFETAVELCEPC
jgi:hypothetical protein